MIPPQHFGSQKNLTTNDAINIFNNRLKEDRAKAKPSLSLQTDCSAAFENCKHETLLRKLKHLGFTNDSLELITIF